MPPKQNAKAPKAAKTAQNKNQKTNSQPSPVPQKKKGDPFRLGQNTQNPTPKGVGRPHKTKPFSSFHEAAAGETRNSPYTDPNIIFFAGGALMIAADIKRIKTVFEYAWGNKTAADASKNPSDFWANLKVILVQLLFLFLITMSARVIPPLGRMWLIVIIGLWILFLIKNPQILKMLQVAGNP